MHSLIILRGLPGAGKTTLVEILSDNKWPVYSIDDYFTDPKTGDYKFEFDKNHLAYKQCAFRAEEAMKNKTEKIFIDNTFTMEWEMEPYFDLAGKYSYKLFVMTVENRHGSGNIHGIPEEQLKKMAEKFKVVLYK